MAAMCLSGNTTLNTPKALPPYPSLPVRKFSRVCFTVSASKNDEAAEELKAAGEKMGGSIVDKFKEDTKAFKDTISGAAETLAGNGKEAANGTSESSDNLTDEMKKAAEGALASSQDAAEKINDVVLEKAKETDDYVEEKLKTEK